MSITTIHNCHDSPITALTISDGDPLMVASAEMTVPMIHIWHPKDGAIVTKLAVERCTKIITCLSFCSNGRYIAALSDASVVHVFNWVKGKDISSAELKAGGVVSVKFASETTVAALTPKALFLCDMIGNALLPTRTLVPPGILPDPDVVLTSLTVDLDGRVFVGCSDVSIVEWSARIAVKRSNKLGVVTAQQKSLVIRNNSQFKAYHYFQSRFNICYLQNLQFVVEHHISLPSKTWTPSAISSGSSYLIIGAMKNEPFLLFNIAQNTFNVIESSAFSPKGVSKGENTSTDNVEVPLRTEQRTEKKTKRDSKKENWFRKWL
ncbi:hypothetical protein Avbf_06663 [Armadillidium vulgare]|nr:hypothetical protein Avbf_06663 [Armadillidium vulgare]